MEIAALTTFLTPFLPYLLKLGKGAAETATETAANKFGEAAWQKAQTVWTRLSPKVEAKASAKEAAADVASNPTDEDAQAALRLQLKKLLANDEALAEQLAQILQKDTPKLGTQITQTVTGNQNQVIGQVSGGQVFGNVTGSVVVSGSGNSVDYRSQQTSAPKASALQVKTILVLAANPKGTSRLRLDQEIREIQSGLERASHRDRFQMEQRWAVRPRDIQRALLDCNPAIVHFSGHGVGTSQSEAAGSTRDIGFAEDTSGPASTMTQSEGLMFEDETGHAKLVSTEALASLFSLFSDKIECVVLNACYSAVQANAIAQHIPYVVGMKRAIGDRAAIEFSVSFYDALLAGRPVDFAYKLGCNGIQMQGIPEHLTPVLKQS